MEIMRVLVVDDELPGRQLLKCFWAILDTLRKQRAMPPKR